VNLAERVREAPAPLPYGTSASAGSTLGAGLHFSKVAKTNLPTEEVMLRLHKIIARGVVAVLIAAGAVALLSAPAEARCYYRWPHHYYCGHYYGYHSYYYGTPYYPPYYSAYAYPPPYYAPPYYGPPPYAPYYGPGYGYYGGPSITFGFGFGGGHHHW
jgi:hypothetical protein